MPIWNFLDDVLDLLDNLGDPLDVELDDLLVGLLKEVLGGDEPGPGRHITGTNRIDFLSGKGGNDVIKGKEGSDLILGWDGNDKLYGDQDKDRIYGGNGNDAIYGGTGDDYLDGAKGADVLIGNTGRDTLYGGTGNDVLVGGNPVTVGGKIVGGLDDKRTDVFVFDSGEGNDSIYGFKVGGSAHDLIDLTRIGGVDDLSDIPISVYDNNNDGTAEGTLITLPARSGSPVNTILLVGVDPSTFTPEVAAEHILF